MRAITCSGYGRPSEVLRADDIEVPTLADDQVLVLVHAASLNPADWHLIRGKPYIARLQVGLRRPGFRVPGSDFAGVVEAVGPAVTTLRPGDEVYGTTFMAGFGAFAEKVAVPERLVARRPRNVSDEEAAAAPLAACTALQALRDHGKVQRGQKVLIIGASGGVGTYAVQIAKHLGAEVTGVCSTANVDLVAGLGADHVVDYTTQDVVAAPDRYDVVVQVAGTLPASRLRRLLTADGTLVQISGDSPNRWVGPLGRIVAGRLRSVFGGRTVTSFTVAPDQNDLDLLASLIDDGTVRTHVDRTCALGDIGAALETLEAGRTRGKVTVTIAGPAQREQAGPHNRSEAG
jgi:NADPH:quinone reductase-like Zn-dependent oxidoreductase